MLSRSCLVGKVLGKPTFGSLCASSVVARRFCATGSAASVAATPLSSSCAEGCGEPDTTTASFLDFKNDTKRTPPRNVLWKDAKETLKSLRPVQYSKLANGFKVATEHIPGLEFVTIGVWIDAGSRFETRETNGVAHFLEHMNFKGTKNYNKKQIEDVFESLGAHFNAYTSRDRTAYYIKVFNKDVPRVIDLLADILKNSIHDPRYVELERPTILSEMREVEELVDEVIQDNLHFSAYDGSHCGLPLTILGPTENIARHINRAMIKDYVATHYTGPRMTMVSCGGLSAEEVHALADKHFSDLSSESNRPVLSAKYTGGTATMWNDSMMTAQVHLAFPVCGANNKDVVPLQLLHYFYGSYRQEMMLQFIRQGRNAARPFMPELDRTQFFFTPYEETGLMGYQLTAVPSAENRTTLARTFSHIMESVQDLIERPPTMEQLEGAKAAYKAAQMLVLDSTTNSAEDLGRQMVHFGRRVPLQEHFERVDAITPNIFADTLAKYFDGSHRPTLSAAGPPDALPAFDALRNVMAKSGMVVH